MSKRKSNRTRNFGIAACAVAALIGGVAVAAATDRDDPTGSTASERGRPQIAGSAPVEIADSEPPRAVIRGCVSRISGGAARLAGDTVVGPLRFNMQSYSSLRAWRQQVRRRQWLKSVARVRAGRTVTLVVPPEQRPWMRLRYAHRGESAVALRACRHRSSLAARRRECVWAEGTVGPPGRIRDDYTACRSGPTFFSGGFEIDYDAAPQQGRCAELSVWAEGELEPRTVRLLRGQPGECADDVP